MRVVFIDIDREQDKNKEPCSIATVSLDICPKVGERYVIFGVGYRVEETEHTVTVEKVGREGLIVVELINCFLKRIELIGKEAEQQSRFEGRV